jgi:hypothetical protein
MPQRSSTAAVLQWTDILLIAHDVHDKRHHAIEKKFDIGRPFHSVQLILLTVAFTRKATVVYVDGKLVGTSLNFLIGRRNCRVKS